MNSGKLTALPRLFQGLATRLATAKEEADAGYYTSAFGYLEGAVQHVLDTWNEVVVTLEGGESGGSAEVELPAYNSVDVWRDVDWIPLYPDNL